MSGRTNQLLPRGHEEFRTKAYWDDFFRQRGDRAFEWYGDYGKLCKLCAKNMDNRDRVLVVGCGNSDYSADLYDAGFRYITNIDFSETVIQSMAIRNALRDEMRWLVMDMTAMSLGDASFDVVFDKGGLDALMAVESAEVRAKADAMFADIARVTKPGGRYLCVTLAEPFIIFHLLHFFLAAGWEVSIDVVSECGGREVPFVPFFVSMTRPVRAAADRAAHEVYPIKLFFDSFGERTRRPTVVEPNDALEQIRRVQSYQQRQHDLGRISVGRFEQIDLWAGPFSGEVAVSETIPKYTLTILDRTLQAPRSCAVFFIPMGREASYQFTAQECLADIAEQAQAKRLLVVRCNRPHIFPDMKGMQAELSPVCRSLAPLPSGGVEEPIPFMGVESESEWVEVAAGNGPMTGEYVVEETKAAESGLASGTVYRRLIFLRNQQFIQTEVRLTPAPGGKHKKKKKKAEGNASTPADVDEGRLLRFDHQYLDAHHCSILVCLSLLTGQSAPVGLLVGLGGGALAMAIRRYFNSSLLTVVELDPVLIDVAKGFFGYAPDANTTNVVGDGMQYMLDCAGSCSEAAGADAPPSVPPSEAVLLDFIVLDADSADSSRGLSAPPQEFTADTAVAAMRSLLSPRGILVVNTVARDKNELRRFVDAIKEVFVPAGGDMYILKPSEDTVNLTILGVASSSAVLEKAAALFTLPGPNSGKKGKRDGAKVGSKAPTGADDLRSVVQLSVQQLLREVNGRNSLPADCDPLGLRLLVELLRGAD